MSTLVDFASLCCDAAKQPNEERSAQLGRTYKDCVGWFDGGWDVAQPLAVVKVSAKEGKTIRDAAWDAIETAILTDPKPILIGYTEDENGKRVQETRPATDFLAWFRQFRAENASAKVQYRTITGYGRMAAMPYLLYAAHVYGRSAIAIATVEKDCPDELSELDARVLENSQPGKRNFTKSDLLALARRYHSLGITGYTDLARRLGVKPGRAQLPLAYAILNAAYKGAWHGRTMAFVPLQGDARKVKYTPDGPIPTSVWGDVTDLRALCGRARESKVPSSVADACRGIPSAKGWTVTGGDVAPQEVVERYVALRMGEGGRPKQALGGKVLSELAGVFPIDSLVRGVLSSIAKGDREGTMRYARLIEPATDADAVADAVADAITDAITGKG